MALRRLPFNQQRFCFISYKWHIKHATEIKYRSRTGTEKDQEVYPRRFKEIAKRNFITSDQMHKRSPFSGLKIIFSIAFGRKFFDKGGIFFIRQRYIVTAVYDCELQKQTYFFLT